MPYGSKLAASSRTVVVPPPISVSSPPMIPASAIARSASAISRSSGTRSRVTPSSVVSFSPLSARRTTICPPWSVVKSKAWSGFPSANITKFVMSTTFEMGRWPARKSRVRSHCGEGPIATSSNRWPTYRGQPAKSSIRMATVFFGRVW
jgi:hypothetical protein